MPDKGSLPSSRQLVVTVVQALREFGREAHVREIEDQVANMLNLTFEQLAEPHDKSRSEFQYRLGWARTYAKRDGLIISVARNRWRAS